MEKQKIESILLEEYDGMDVTIVSQTPIKGKGATLTLFQAVEYIPCRPEIVHEISCITYDDDNEHLYIPMGWDSCPTSLEEIAEYEWVTEKDEAVPIVNGLPHVL